MAVARPRKPESEPVITIWPAPRSTMLAPRLSGPAPLGPGRKPGFGAGRPDHTPPRSRSLRSVWLVGGAAAALAGIVAIAGLTVPRAGQQPGTVGLQLLLLGQGLRVVSLIAVGLAYYYWC